MGQIAVIEPGTEEFASAFPVYNVSVAQSPAGGVVARSVEDLQGAVAYARENSLQVAVQATGHRAIALPSLENALLVRTALDGRVEIDPQRRRARVPAGAVWDQVIPAASEHGLTALHGSAPTVGIAGYTVGGGLGFYARKHGLMCNRVISFDVVTADGRALTIDADNEPDLFWAMRGGGTLAAVTALEFDLLPIEKVFAGQTFWPLERGREVLEAYARFCATAPDEFTTTCRFLRLPPLPFLPPEIAGKNSVTINGAFLGDPAEGEELLAELRAIGPTLLDTWSHRPAREVTRIHIDPEEPLPYDAVSALVGDLDDSFIEALVDVAGHEAEGLEWLTVVELRHLGGALARPQPGAGITSTLPGSYLFFGLGVTPEPQVVDILRGNFDAVFAAAKPWTTDKTYMNFDERPSSAESCFSPEDCARLREVCAEYDPEGLFLRSHAIEAATA